MWPAANPAGLAPARLHVPEPPYRPGDEPRFARFPLPGELPRPEPTAAAEMLRPHATGLVRALQDDATAAGPWDPQLPPSTLIKGLRFMVQARAYDARLMTMQRQGRLSFYLEAKGEEAVAIAAGMALRSDDLLFPSYRQTGLFLVRGMPPLEMMCHCIGNRRDGNRGRQMPVHYSWKKGNIVSLSSPVGTQFPQAVGAAMATAYRRETNVTVAWIGEGSSAQGDFHHGLNFASVYRPPVLLNVVNNQWAISTHCRLATGGTTFAARADAYGIPGIRVDGNDFPAVYAVTSWAAERARQGAGPTLIELFTYRRGAHSSSDDPSRYRPNREGQLWPGGDPIERLAAHLTKLGVWSTAQQLELEQEAKADSMATYKQAEQIGSFTSGPFDPPETLFEDVYRQIPWHLARQRDEIVQSTMAAQDEASKAA
ncbi:MAG: 2-oxoisovalerate dehydrogenase [Planctomycetes bacterium RBG_16_64_10]|nr:MAG: 2-oxoisovalerate dehydrogenase [Planctomycetes bacterium RBG_16_64_10]